MLTKLVLSGLALIATSIVFGSIWSQANDARRQWVLHLGRITQWLLPRPQDPDAGRGPWMDMCILEMMHALRTAPFDIHYTHLTQQGSEALLRQHAEEICAEAWDRGTQGRRERHQYLMSIHPSALPDALRHMAEMRQQTMFDHMDSLPPGHDAAARAMHPLPMILPALALVLPPLPPPQEPNDLPHPDAAPSHGPPPPPPNRPRTALFTTDGGNTWFRQVDPFSPDNGSSDSFAPDNSSGSNVNVSMGTEPRHRRRRTLQRSP